MRRALVFVFAVALGCSGDRSVLDPPFAHARDLVRAALPSDDDLRVEMAEAIATRRVEERERAMEALEPGEAFEHATLRQSAFDARAISLDELLRVGDDLFAYQFRTENGLGNGAGGKPPNLRRVHLGDAGGPDALSCSECHSQGGDDGAGAASQNAFFRGDGDRTRGADVRNPPALLGTGPIQALANEMTLELVDQRAQAVGRAIESHAAQTVELRAKGIAFGTLRVSGDGKIDASGVTGVSPDLVVRPFGWKGHQRDLRDMARESFRVHLGLVALVDQQAVRDGRAQGPPGVPWYDLDNDGVSVELDDGMLTTIVAYLAQLEVPIVQPPRDAALLARFDRGEQAFAHIGCARCHVPALPLDNPILVTRAEEIDHEASAPIVVDVARAGRAPKIARAGDRYTVALFSDLRRHDLGDALASPHDQPSSGGPIAARVWLTRPLWGLADTAPYLHDGRAPTIDDAIRAHGGEASAARAAYAALPDDARGDLLVFLTSLARTRKLVVP